MGGDADEDDGGARAGDVVGFWQGGFDGHWCLMLCCNSVPVW